MGMNVCRKKHYFGIGSEEYTCEHISQNLDNDIDQPCQNIRIRIYNVPGYIASTNEPKDSFEYLPLCTDCVDNFGLDQNVKVEYSPDLIEKAIENFGLVEECPDCLKEYIKRNEIVS